MDLLDRPQEPCRQPGVWHEEWTGVVALHLRLYVLAVL